MKSWEPEGRRIEIERLRIVRGMVTGNERVVLRLSSSDVMIAPQTFDQRNARGKTRKRYGRCQLLCFVDREYADLRP